MRGLSMYSGAGGMDVAASMAGVEIIAHCESDAWCREQLAAHWPGTRIYNLDTEITRERLEADGVFPIDIVFGGPPCTSASSAGKRLGESDPRWRWSEFLRVVRDVRPRWVLAENVRGLQTLDGGKAIRKIHHTLAAMGYRTGQGLHGADAVGAPHRRDRVFIVACLADAGRESLAARGPSSGLEEE